MAESVVSFVVERIGDLLIQEGNFLAGVSDQVRQMQTELQRMQNFLQDADNRQDESNSVRGWVSEIRDLAYDAENVIESFALRVSSRREKGFRNKCKRYATIFIEGAHVHKVGMEIEAIRARMTSLTTSLTTYGIQFKNEPQVSTSLQQKLKRSYSHLVEEQTIGLDNDVKNLVTKLRVEGTDVGQIVSICGMGGLGKTTLANKVYHHVSVRDHFDAFAWYCVSQQFQPRLVWEGILFNLVSPSKERRDEISKMNDDEIAKELFLLQKNKKCLVVLDDIWKKNAWDLLQPAFPIGEAGGSKIILTSRNKTLARHADPNAFIQELQTLNEHDSWELFLTKAFPKNINSGFKSNMDMDMDKEKLGEKIVKKCAGLPLAIILLGGLLRTKYYVTEWDKVHKDFDLYLKRGKGTDQEHSDVHWVLALSYNELPFHLKPCFLHLGNFPEDYDIPCKTLIRMWVAEGFASIDGARDEIMEDVVERYLDDLIDRSIVQVSQMGSIGKLKTCRLHDLMRDFCLSKAHQENYLKIVHTTILKEKLNSNRVHRLVAHRNDINDTHLGYYARTPYLRSFLLISPKMDFPSIKISLNYFKLLKIVSLMNCKIVKKMGKEIGGLIHLRYLAIEDCIIEALPSSIGNLRYLQTLIIRSEVRLPNVVWKLEQLRHLVLKDCRLDDESLKLGNMRELQTLQCDGSDFKTSDIGVLENSPNLNKLGIKIELGVDEIPSVNLRRLSSMSIRRVGGYSGIGSKEEGLKKIFSRCIQPPNLTKLTLVDCGLEEDPMPILEKLPNLRILRLKWRSFEGRLLVCSSKGFPKLQTLQLSWLFNLEEWSVDEEAMHNLSNLHIGYCPRLKMMPEGIKFITTLRQLDIQRMPIVFEDRVVPVGVDGREGEDFYKIRHVPHISIRYTWK